MGSLVTHVAKEQLRPAGKTFIFSMIYYRPPINLYAMFFFISAPWFKRAFLWIYICLLGSGLACLSLFRFFWLCLVVLAHVFVDNKFQQHWFSVQLKVAPNHPNVSRHADVTSLSSQLEEVDKEEELLKNILGKKNIIIIIM